MYVCMAFPYCRAIYALVAYSSLNFNSFILTVMIANFSAYLFYYVIVKVSNVIMPWAIVSVYLVILCLRGLTYVCLISHVVHVDFENPLRLIITVTGFVEVLQLLINI